MKLAPVTLNARLVPPGPTPKTASRDLTVAAADDAICTYLDEPTPWTRESVERFISDAGDEEARGVRVPFAIISNVTGAALGSTSYLDIRPQDRGVEIGCTWLTSARWG